MSMSSENHDTGHADSYEISGENYQEIALKIGEQLRNVRLEKNIDLELIADELKIREHHLTNFENGNYEALPETPYALGFIKSYAQYLEIETDHIIKQFRPILNSRGGNEKNIIGIDEAPVSRTSLYYVFIAAIVMCFLLYVLWTNYSQTGSFSFFNEKISQTMMGLHFYEYS